MREKLEIYKTENQGKTWFQFAINHQLHPEMQGDWWKPLSECLEIPEFKRALELAEDNEIETLYERM